MKIYNKKGLLWGIVWTAAGAFCLYRDAADASGFLPQQIKSVVLSLIMLAVGITGFVRAFSKRASMEDRVEERDERSRLVRLKTSARTLSILMWVQLGTMVLGLLAYAFTENLVWGCLFLFSGLTITLEAVVSIAAAVYYEKRS